MTVFLISYSAMALIATLCLKYTGEALASLNPTS